MKDLLVVEVQETVILRIPDEWMIMEDHWILGAGWWDMAMILHRDQTRHRRRKIVSPPRSLHQHIVRTAEETRALQLRHTCGDCELGIAHTVVALDTGTIKAALIYEVAFDVLDWSLMYGDEEPPINHGGNS